MKPIVLIPPPTDYELIISPSLTSEPIMQWMEDKVLLALGVPKEYLNWDGWKAYHKQRDEMIALKLK